MAKTSFDAGALRWVREEMDASLARARDALEAYLREDKADAKFIQQCQQALHEVLGVLTMLEVRSGASLVAEMEVVCGDIANGRLRDSEQAYEALMEAILSLPSYLEDLQSAHGESLASLQPLMDGLRTSRGAKPLRVEGETAPVEQARVVSDDIPPAAEIAREVRPKYQVALLKVMRDDDAPRQLRVLAGATVRVEQASRDEDVYRFWWLCGGLIEVIADGTQALDMDTKKLLGQIDRQLKRLMDSGEESWKQEMPEAFIETVKQMMMESQSASERVQEIADYYYQSELNNGAEAEDAAQVSGINNQLMETVASAVQEDLSRIKDGLDLFKRSESTKTSDLERLIEPLHAVGDTLELLGMGVLRDIVIEKQAVIEGIISGKIHPTNRGLMELASALLYVESSLGTLVEQGHGEAARGDEVLQSLREVKQGRVDDDAPEFEPLVDAMAGPDYRQVINAVISEAANDIARAKDAITGYLQSPDDVDEIEAVPGLFDQVRGGLLMLEMERAAEYLQAISLYLSIKLIKGHKQATQEQIDLLADGISAIEYYLEAVGENRSNTDAILDLAETSLKGLGYPWPDSWAAQLIAPAGESEAEPVLDTLPPLPVDDLELGPVPELGGDEGPVDEEVVDEGMVDEEMPGEESLNEHQVDEHVIDEPSPAQELADDVPGMEVTETVSVAEVPGEAAADELTDTLSLDSELAELVLDAEEGAENTGAVGDDTGSSSAATTDTALFDADEIAASLEAAHQGVMAGDEGPGNVEIGDEADSIGLMQDPNALSLADGSAEAHQSEFDAILEGMAELDVDEDTILKTDSEFEVGTVNGLDSQAMGLSEGELLDTDSLLDEALVLDDSGLATSAEEALDGLTDEAEAIELPEGLDTQANAGPGQDAAQTPAEQTAAAEDAPGDTFEGLTVSESDDGLEPLILDTHAGLEADADAADLDETGDFGLVDLGDGGELVEMAFGEESLTDVLTHDLASSKPESASEAVSPASESGSDAPPPGAAASLAIDPETAALLSNPLADDLDEEILEIFIEEATEELESVEQQLPVWQANRSDSAAISSIRRSFHTLKGSGRLAGAKLLGEFAWSHEHLLNRIIDGSVEASDDVFALMNDTVGEALPQLIAQLQGGAAPEVDLVYLMQSAEGLCKGTGYIASADRVPETTLPEASAVATFDEIGSDEVEPGEVELDEIDMDAAFDAAIADLEANTLDLSDALEEDSFEEHRSAEQASEQTSEDTPEPASLSAASPASETAPASEALSEAVSASASGVSTASAQPAAKPRIDPVLLDIFRDETLSNLEMIRAWADASRVQGAGQVNDDIMRPLHTLHGSAHMAEVTEIADLCGSFERYGRELAKTNAVFRFADLELLLDVCDSIESMLPALADRDLPFPLVDGLVARITARFAERQHELGGQGQAASAQTGTDTGALTAEGRPHPSGAAMVGAAAAALTRTETGTVAATPPEATGTEATAPEVTVEVTENNEGDADSEPAVAEPMVAEVEGLANLPSDLQQDLPELPDDIDPDLLGIFIEEAEELLDDADHNLSEWKKDFTDFAPIPKLQRDLHTLKGGARMAGVESIADLSHTLESVFDAIADGSTGITSDSYLHIHRCFDRLVLMLGQLRDNRMPAQQAGLTAILEAIRLGEELPSNADTAPPAAALATDTRSAITANETSLREPVSTASTLPESGGEAAAAESSETLAAVDTEPVAKEPAVPATSLDIREGGHPNARHDLVRVDSEHLGDLVNLAGEVSIYRSRLEQKVGGFQVNLGDLDQTISRLQEQLRQLEIETEAQILSRFDRVDDNNEDFDPLEFDRYSKLQHLAKGLMESASDVVSVKQALEDNTRETETLLVQQARINTDLQEGLMHTRMVPFSTLVPRLSRLLRQVSHELGKQCQLQVSGDEGELDRKVLDRITAPLEHLIRNAVFHGIELPAERSAAGKPEQGTVTIRLDRRGAEVVIEISDDGRGVNIEAVRNKAVQLGLLDSDYEISDFDLQQVILEPGFSTADALSKISGRGVGMDVVNSEVKQLGGSLEIHSEAGQGSRFTLRLPFTLAINRALLGRVGDEVYAVPLASLDGVVRFGRDELEKVYSAETPLYDYGGHTYTFHYLGTLVDSGLPELPEQGDTLPVLLIQAGDARVALQIDGLIGSREIVVKSLGPQLSGIPGLSGATILGDGRVVVILEVGALLRRESGTPMQRMQRAMAKADVRVEEARPTLVMVVDDSVTMRKVATRLLERKGFEVVTANDGVDALARLHDRVPDVVLLDIEMPRMDGYELAGHMRNNVRFKEIPIIMITSRTGTKHRERADALGVDRYLGKPWQEAELLEHIRELTESADD